jgi:hypothetical protein
VSPTQNISGHGRAGDCAREEDSITSLAGKIATQRSGGTLEMRLRDAGVDMPLWNFGPAAKAVCN